jgi:hypothetical protein
MLLFNVVYLLESGAFLKVFAGFNFFGGQAMVTTD